MVHVVVDNEVVRHGHSLGLHRMLGSVVVVLYVGCVSGPYGGRRTRFSSSSPLFFADFCEYNFAGS
jgi:hypothetical protein